MDDLHLPRMLHGKTLRPLTPTPASSIDATDALAIPECWSSPGATRPAPASSLTPTSTPPWTPCASLATGGGRRRSRRTTACQAIRWSTSCSSAVDLTPPWPP